MKGDQLSSSVMNDYSLSLKFFEEWPVKKKHIYNFDGRDQAPQGLAGDQDSGRYVHGKRDPETKSESVKTSK
jgi:hypothetical protein